EGHPTPTIPFVRAATGSLGQGLSIGAGIALANHMDSINNKMYVLLGDGELAEGNVWEAADFISYKQLNNLCCIVDVNRLGQSMQTRHEHNTETYASRFRSFGWHTIVVNGHNIAELQQAFNNLHKEKPTAIIAQTLKGKGVDFMQDKEGWHGKPVSKEQLHSAIQQLEINQYRIEQKHPEQTVPISHHIPDTEINCSYQKNAMIATREAYGKALAKLGHHQQLVVLDADTSNSTKSDEFKKIFPERFIECHIAEQNMTAVAVGLSSMGKIPCASTFGAFWTRAFDQLRLASISSVKMLCCGSHAGVSIGEDGPSQMAIEDIAMFRALNNSIVLYPCDAVSTEKLVACALAHQYTSYIRTTRGTTAVVYDNNHQFKIGGSSILKSSPSNKVLVVAAGITVHEALAASQHVPIRVLDTYSIKPIDDAALLKNAKECNNTVLVVEDHRVEGGLADAVAQSLSSHGIHVHRLGIDELSHSGTPEKLRAFHKIDANAIVEKIKLILKAQSI
ncbi:MAG TPA: transketolase, partial [Candidatus Nanoarchaeia archaeon]|nr:transketolase [Candidatus Nanoarchaeia archaeon]